MNKLFGILALFVLTISMLPLAHAANTLDKKAIKFEDASGIPALPDQDAALVANPNIYRVTFQKGYNLFSVPLINAVLTLTTCQPNSVWVMNTEKYVYDNAGKMTSGLMLGNMVGYWYRNTDTKPCYAYFKGVARLEPVELTMKEYQGVSDKNLNWNMIGSPYNTVKFDAIKGNCEIVQGPLKYENGNWVPAQELVKGTGYFVKVLSKCQLGTNIPIPSNHVEIQEWSDFQCPYCARSQETLKQLEAEYGNKISRVFRHFPLSSIHTNAWVAAEASECARDQGKFDEYRDILFTNQDALAISDLKSYAGQLGLNTVKFNSCFDSAVKNSIVEADQKEGTAKGISGTPTFYFNNQEVLVGAQPIERFEEIINRLLEETPSTKLPDLTIASIGNTPDNPNGDLKPGIISKFNVEVRNIGNALAPSSKLKIGGISTVDAGTDGLYTVPALGVGESTRIYFKFYVPSSQSTTIYATIDPANNIKESNENNNAISLVINPNTQYGADLGIVDIGFSNSNPKVGETFTVYTTIKNYGTKEGILDSREEYFTGPNGEVEGASIGPRTSIQPGQTQTYNFQHTLIAAGSWNLKTSLSVREDANSANNALIKNIYVGTSTKGPDLGIYSLEFNPTTGYVNNDVIVTAKLYNYGDETAKLTSYSFMLSSTGKPNTPASGASAGSSAITVSPGNYYTITFTNRFASEGYWNLKLNIYSEKDMNYGNNELSRGIYIYQNSGVTCPTYNGDGLYATYISCTIKSTGGHTVKLVDIASFPTQKAQINVYDQGMNLVKTLYLAVGDKVAVTEANNLVVAVTGLYNVGYGTSAYAMIAVASGQTPCEKIGDGTYDSLGIGCKVKANSGHYVKVMDISSLPPSKVQLNIYDASNNLLKTMYLEEGQSNLVSTANNLYINVDHIFPGAFGGQGVVSLTIQSFATLPTPTPTPAPFVQTYYEINIKNNYAGAADLIQLFRPSDRWRFDGQQSPDLNSIYVAVEDGRYPDNDYNDLAFTVGAHSDQSRVSLSLVGECETAATNEMTFKLIGNRMATLEIEGANNTVTGLNPEIQLWPTCHGNANSIKTVLIHYISTT